MEEVRGRSSLATLASLFCFYRVGNRRAFGLAGEGGDHRTCRVLRIFALIVSPNVLSVQHCVSSCSLVHVEGKDTK